MIVKLSPEQAEIVSRFRRSGAKYFQKVMTKGSVSALVKGPYAYQLEFPVQFLNDYAEQFTEKAILETPDSGKKWPLGIEVRTVNKVQNIQRVFAYRDGGWRDFVLENNLKLGDLLIFILVGFSRFRVHIFPCEDNRINEDHHDESPETASEESSEDISDEAPADTKCSACGQSPPAPRFGATVIAKSVLANTIFEVPASFWKRHHRMLRGDVIRLTGPNKEVMDVKCVAYTRGKYARVRLESGWIEFSNANELVSGDNLLFSLTGPSRFNVQILDS